jgi:hypothetical protein
MRANLLAHEPLRLQFAAMNLGMMCAVRKRRSTSSAAVPQSPFAAASYPNASGSGSGSAAGGPTANSPRSKVSTNGTTWTALYCCRGPSAAACAERPACCLHTACCSPAASSALPAAKLQLLSAEPGMQTLTQVAAPSPRELSLAHEVSFAGSYPTGPPQPPAGRLVTRRSGISRHPAHKCALVQAPYAGRHAAA